ncbi:unnamed protein product [Linum tenue]|uniref:Bifunctional inhibitor/plant lipid transfer protein/seed storage helical domain-containing protein n=1 Tax=Linum tenue TaxID=586396 RepID=A0AAV0P532_9ROSI|nr:unnamed protein product [Linum tenue]
MASFKPTSLLLLISMVASLSLLTSPAHGQITTSCSSTAIAALAPCMSFLTNSSGTGSSPTAGCCDTLKNLTGTSLDCMCLVVTGSVPFQIPINRTLAISLPRACNMPGVPLQCKAAGAPVPAPGSVVPETPSPESGTTTPDLTPPSSTTGSTPTINTSAAAASYSFSPSLVVLAVGFVLCKFY